MPKPELSLGNHLRKIINMCVYIYIYGSSKWFLLSFLVPSAYVYLFFPFLLFLKLKLNVILCFSSFVCPVLVLILYSLFYAFFWMIRWGVTSIYF